MQEWQNLRSPSEKENALWELFHENSKIGRLSRTISNDEIIERMQGTVDSLIFEGYPATDLPNPKERLPLSLTTSIVTRASARSFRPCTLSLRQLATLLHYAYGVTRHNRGTSFPRPFRVVPSGGALYPLELFFHSAHITDLHAGIYHYNPCANNIRLLSPGDHTRMVAERTADPDTTSTASLVLFITAIFPRSVFKYGNRGYRFAFLEAGHVAQNLNLVANAMRLASVNIGGYFDREMDEFLGLDGLHHSVIYMVAIGNSAAYSKQFRLHLKKL